MLMGLQTNEEFWEENWGVLVKIKEYTFTVILPSSIFRHLSQRNTHLYTKILALFVVEKNWGKMK